MAKKLIQMKQKICFLKEFAKLFTWFICEFIHQLVLEYL